ncbi:MAG: PilZ domain-containing protein [Elusimicrobiota bacterium]
MRTNEKRRAPRTRHDSVLELYDECGRLSPSNARLVDFSAVGARIATPAAFAKGSRVRGRMRLLRDGALDMTGRIVRIEPGTNFRRYAIEFDDVRRAPGGFARAPTDERPA